MMKEWGGNLRERVSHVPSGLRHILAAGAWSLLLNRYSLEFTQDSKNYLDEANRLLLDNSVVMYVNHTSMADAPLAVSMVYRSLTNAERVMGPAGMRHMDPRRDKKNSYLLHLLEPLGITLLPVVQDGDTTDYGEEKMRMIANLKAKTEAALNLPGTLYGIAPEGTRSKTGAMARARRGIGHLEKYNPDLYYVPVAIVYKEIYKNSKIEVGRPLRLSDMLTPEDLVPVDPKEKAQFFTDIHMRRLAGMLPTKMRGVYG